MHPQSLALTFKNLVVNFCSEGAARFRADLFDLLYCFSDRIDELTQEREELLRALEGARASRHEVAARNVALQSEVKSLQSSLRFVSSERADDQHLLRALARDKTALMQVNASLQAALRQKEASGPVPLPSDYQIHAANSHLN